MASVVLTYTILYDQHPRFLRTVISIPSVDCSGDILSDLFNLNSSLTHEHLPSSPITFPETALRHVSVALPASCQPGLPARAPPSLGRGLAAQVSFSVASGICFHGSWVVNSLIEDKEVRSPGIRRIWHSRWWLIIEHLKALIRLGLPCH